MGLKKVYENVDLIETNINLALEELKQKTYNYDVVGETISEIVRGLSLL